MKNNEFDISKIEYNPNIPLPEHFFDDGRVCFEKFDEWAEHNQFAKTKDGDSVRSCSNIIKLINITDNGGARVYKGFCKHSRHMEHYAEYLFSRSYRHFGVPTPAVYYAKNDTSDNWSLSDCVADEHQKLLNGTYVLSIPLTTKIPSLGLEGKNCVKDYCTIFTHLQKNPLYLSDDRALIVDPDIKWNLVKLSILDFCFGQSDRHSNNIGFLFDSKTGTISLAPLWDNGHACGLYDPSLTTITTALSNKDKFDALDTDDRFGVIHSGIRLPLFEHSYTDAFLTPSGYIEQFASIEFAKLLAEIYKTPNDIKHLLREINNYTFGEEADTAFNQTGIEVPCVAVDILDEVKEQRTYAIAEQLATLKLNFEELQKTTDNIPFEGLQEQ